WAAVRLVDGIDARYIPLVAAGVSALVAAVGLWVNFHLAPVRVELHKRRVEAVLAIKKKVDEMGAAFDVSLRQHAGYSTALHQRFADAMLTHQEHRICLPEGFNSLFLDLIEQFANAANGELPADAPRNSYLRFVRECRRIVGSDGG